MASVLSGSTAAVRVKLPDGSVIPVGFVRGISVNEDIRYDQVKVLGSLYTQEMVPVDHAGTGSFESYVETTPNSSVNQIINRNFATKEAFQDYLNSQQVTQGLIFDVLGRNPTTGEFGPVATIKYVFITNQSFNVTQGAMSMRNVSFSFTEPILQTA